MPRAVQILSSCHDSPDAGEIFPAPFVLKKLSEKPVCAALDAGFYHAHTKMIISSLVEVMLPCFSSRTSCLASIKDLGFGRRSYFRHHLDRN